MDTTAQIYKPISDYAEAQRQAASRLAAAVASGDEQEQREAYSAVMYFEQMQREAGKSARRYEDGKRVAGLVARDLHDSRKVMKS